MDTCWFNGPRPKFSTPISPPLPALTPVVDI